MRLVDLPGVAGGVIEDAMFAKSVSGAINVLRKHRAATGAGDYGAWTIWRDDNGHIRCEFSRHRMAINETTCRSLNEVRDWLVEWLPMTQRVAA